MTNHWIDIKNSNAVLVMGSNPASNHPVSFKWIEKARENGGKLISVDPRFTQTSSRSDIYAPLRFGTDIAFLGGMIKYILDNDLYFKQYVRDYTNATFIVSKDYAFNDGLFSGFKERTDDSNYGGKYNKESWQFELDEDGVPKRDMSMQHPRCVFNLLKKHYQGYTLDKVSMTTGTPVKDLRAVYENFASTGKADRAGTIMYAMGWTQHSTGVQNIRAMAMIQLLLGNIGVAGGGVNALRGESNVQGSTDHCLLWHILPGYLKTPRASQSTLDEYNKAYTPVSNDPKSANWWNNYPKYSVSLLKSMYPEVDKDKAYKWLPKVDDGQTYSWLEMFDYMHEGKFKGFFAWGQNPCCSSANANKARESLSQLDWMVNVNLFDNETGSFWKGPNMDPSKVKTEVFFLPCCAFLEKEGSITNSGRWMQWRYQGPKPYATTKSDGHIICELMSRLRWLYRNKEGNFPEPILNLGYHLWQDSHGYNAHKIAKLVNGFFLKDTEVNGKKFRKGQQVPSFAYLTDDGSTCSGNWLYCNSYTDQGNMAARRNKKQTKMQANIGLYPNWSWCWPVNRRILYNRASVNMKGQPWNSKYPVIRWTGEKWVGDVPDGGWAPGSKHPFIMRKHGFGQIYGPGRADGPFPVHYEARETPVKENFFSKELRNPVAMWFKDEEFAVADSRYPYVCSTYRVSVHWQSGLMTRHMDWLLEAQPQMFVEISKELAEQLKVANGDKVTVESIRGSVWAIAVVTDRLKPLNVMNKEVHQVGLPWHYGWQFPKDGSGGDSANLLTPSVGDPNTGIPETKTFMVNVRKA
jgi:formate dehydrogenase major subunit